MFVRALTMYHTYLYMVWRQSITCREINDLSQTGAHNMTQQTTPHNMPEASHSILNDLYRAECARIFQHKQGSTPINAFARLEA